MQLSSNKDFNLDRMLHRGEYALQEEQATDAPDRSADGNRNVPGLWGRLGLTVDFTPSDRLVFFGSIIWSMSWFTLFLVGTLYNLLVDVPDSVWLQYWKIHVFIVSIAGAIVTGWFVVGGTLDVRRMLKLLSSREQDITDDGMVYPVVGCSTEVRN